MENFSLKFYLSFTAHLSIPVLQLTPRGCFHARGVIERRTPREGSSVVGGATSKREVE